MIETIKVRKCDICGREMKWEHVTITWPDNHKDDVCHDCTQLLNVKLREMRLETDDKFYVVGIKKDAPWFKPSWEKPLTYLGEFTDPKKAEECQEKRKADFDRVVIVKDLDDAEEIAAEMKEE